MFNKLLIGLFCTLGVGIVVAMVVVLLVDVFFKLLAL